MKSTVSHKLLTCIGALATFVFVLAGDVSADESNDLTASVLTLGITLDEVKATIHSHPLERQTSVLGLAPAGERNSTLGEGIDLSPSHKVIVLTHVAGDIFDGKHLLRTGESLLVFKDGVLVSKEISGHRWATIEPLELDGAPALIVSEWSGGAHCCFEYFLIALQPTPKIVQRIELGDGYGRLEPCGEHMCLHLTDDTFAYWRGPFAGSIDAPVTLSLQDDKFYFDYDLMRQPYVTASDSAINKIQLALRKAEKDSDISVAYRLLGRELLNLIYTGHADKSAILLKRVWPQKTELSAKRSFVSEFTARLQKSRYWPDLLVLNDGRILGAK